MQVELKDVMAVLGEKTLECAIQTGAIQQLQETLKTLQTENAALKAQIAAKSPPSGT